VLGIAADGSVNPRSLADLWAERPIADIGSGDIFSVVEDARQRGVPGVAAKTDGVSEARVRHLFSALSVLFGWCHRRRRIEVNPVDAVHRPAAGKSRDRVLTDAEIQKFWQAADAEQHVGPLLKLLLLTGARLNEVAGLRRSELSNDTWTLPAARAKNGRTHVVPLPPLACELIAAVPNIGSDLLWTTNGRTPVSGWSKTKRRLDAAMNIPPWRLHDLRRTAATGMAEIGIAPHIVEACLNHISGSKSGVAGTYNRAVYGPEKKVALERWASHVAGLVTGASANVVPMRRWS
jgi:integrase